VRHDVKEKTMQDGRNVQIIRDVYAAFGRGDINAVLEQMHDDVVWKPVTGAGPHVPTAGERHGKPSVAEFFRILSQSLTFDLFEPKEFVASGDRVVALGRYAATVKSGRRFASDWAMVFTLRNGQIATFQEFTDSAAINAAF
jgi:ketosteroid isomerase-like protein